MPDEENVVQDFDRYFQNWKNEQGYRNFSTALSGQDRILADQLVCNDMSFALIEFKGTYSDISHENRKELRRKLCANLRLDEELLCLHSQCHYISWRDSTDIWIDIYANCVCKLKVFSDGNCDVDYSSVMGTKPISCLEYVEKLADQTNYIGLDPDHFQKYINNLYKLAETDSGTLRLIASDPANGRFEKIEFSSISDLHNWYNNFYNTYVAPSPTRRRGSHEPGGP